MTKRAAFAAVLAVGNEYPASWRAVDGTITGGGPTSDLFRMVRKRDNCEFFAEVKLNHSGNSGMYVRAACGPGFPKGNVVTDPFDQKNTYTNGYLAWQPHNPGIVVQFRNLMMRPLPAEVK